MTRWSLRAVIVSLYNANRHGGWFLQYDKNHSGALEFEELHAVLADLGILVRHLLNLHTIICTLWPASHYIAYHVHRNVEIVSQSY